MSHSSSANATPSLADVCAVLESIAPLAYASSWDNVGLLLQSRPLRAPVTQIVLTIDLTEAVLEDAVSRGAELVVAYHPPIFGGLKRLTRVSSHERVVLDALAAGVSVYSPHTALDAASGGVCDWLAEGVGTVIGSVPIEPLEGTTGPADASIGAGRVVEISPVSLERIIASIKSHLSLRHLRVAASTAHLAGDSIRRVALCPGAGGALFQKVERADLFLTGEMRHHDVLARRAQGASVIVTDHTHTERGYLPRLEKALCTALGAAVTVCTSDLDDDPLVVR